MALERLEEKLNCSICLYTYTYPKLLQCNHVYCQQCLFKLVIRDQQGHYSLTCPSCRQVTPVPVNGVAGLQTAFRVNQLLEILEEYKKKKVPMTCSERVKETSTQLEKSTVGCPEHGGKEVDLYCETCEKTICWKCIMKGSKHHSHNYQELKKAFEGYKREIMSLLEPMETKLVTIETALAELKEQQDEISTQQASVENEIHAAFAGLSKILDTRKAELIYQLQGLTQTKLKCLAAQRDQIETTQAQLSSCLFFMKENLKTENQEEAMMMKSNTVRQVRELSAAFQPDVFEPITKADIIFSVPASLEDECQKFGEVLTTAPPDPSKCCLVTKDMGTIAVGEPVTAVLQALNSNSKPCSVSKTSITCDLIPEGTRTKVTGKVEAKSPSCCEITFKPTMKGRHQLHIRVNSQHIWGSPFSVIARVPGEEFGTPIRMICGVESPIGVAVQQSGEVVVTQWDKHCVAVFSSNGERLKVFGRCGSGEGQFIGPHGVAVDGEGNVLVADCNNHRIQKFTAQGKFLKAVGTHCDGPYNFVDISGIAYSACNGRVYVLGWDCYIRILNPDLSYFDTFGEKGSSKGQFLKPRHLACDSIGNVYVADRGNHRIQVFTAEGKFLRMFGRHGDGQGELGGPWGITIGSSNRVYVSEWDNHRISIFTSEGHFLTSFGKKGGAPGRFNHPRGLAVNSYGVVFVCDDVNNRIQMF